MEQEQPIPCHFCGKRPLFEACRWYVYVQCVCQDRPSLQFKNLKNAVKGWNLRQKKQSNQLTIITHNRNIDDLNGLI